MKKYITTPLYYVNDKPHLGTAYTNIISDILNRYQKFFGHSTFFLTGVDEHGQKIAQAAMQQDLTPQEHCDRMRKHFTEAWKALNIDYDLFFQTTHKYSDSKELSHAKVVQEVLKKLKAQGDIYENLYKGWYCVSEEIFYTEKDLVDGKSPSGKPVVFLEEKSWFFRMSKYQKTLQNHLKENPKFIEPLERQNEIIGFLKQPLQDLCISRPKTRVSWGIEIPFDESQVVYVWVDALLNYIVGVGYLNSETEFKEKWQKAEVLHLIGKDILMTHAVYWSCLLLALGEKLPDKILAHGWLLNKDSEKMSKSKGDKIDPIELAEELGGVDSLRWFLAREVPLGKDFAISKEYMIQKINEQLADNLGNILSRVSKLVIKYFEGDLSKLQKTNIEDENQNNPLKEMIEKQVLEFEKQIKELQLSQALAGVSACLSGINKYLENQAPWKSVKTDKAEAGFVLYNSLEALRILVLLIEPVMPTKTKELLNFLEGKNTEAEQAIATVEGEGTVVAGVVAEEAVGEKVMSEKVVATGVVVEEVAKYKKIKWGQLFLNKKLKNPPILFPKIQAPTN